MRRSLLVGALLIGTSSMSPAVEVQMDEHTLCPVALRAFDEKDLPAIEEFFRFVQGVFNELSAQDIDQEKTASRTKLTDRNVEVPIILGFCRQHPGSTIYQEAARAYRGMRSLRTPFVPTEEEQAPESTSRFPQPK